MLKLRVSDIKQFFYCQRIIYFTYVCPVDKKVTRKMDYGREDHLRLDGLEKRRTLKRYHLEEGERLFHQRLYSERLGLEGILDMCIYSGRSYFPVEFKFSPRGGGLNHKYQLLAYALLLEEAYGSAVRFGLLYLVPRQQVQEVPLTPDGRVFLIEALEDIRELVAREVMPPPAPVRGRCRDCEYRNFCGDVR
ncbi:MAG: CRISPR-associated protein Cas4 [Firmicutes bacterium]|nr:CRISPR-associated protein Cas4 [Bacillota bacterium]